MKKLTYTDIENVLSHVIDPVSGKDIIRAKMVSGLQVSEKNDVVFLIQVDPAKGTEMEPLRHKAETLVRAMKHVGQVSVILTAEKQPQQPQKSNIPDPHGMQKKKPLTLPFKKIVAIASGKGGVGKSTVAVNLAVALAKQGQKVGLLDADIYGPSVPKLMGVETVKLDRAEDGKLIPIMAHGVGVMSIGFLVKQDTAMIWRGPMVQSAIYQLLRDVQWDGYDVLIIDMPPGTGDAQLTLAQKIQMTGAIIVSTPQDLALMDARKAIEMFRKTNVPILGMVENMSVHVCSNCGHEEHLFGQSGDKGGVALEAKAICVDVLASIPLSLEAQGGLNEATQKLFQEISL